MKNHQVRNSGYGNRTCLDAPGGKKNLKKPVGLYPCHGQGGNQVNYQSSFVLHSVVFFFVFSSGVVVAKIIKKISPSTPELFHYYLNIQS